MIAVLRLVYSRPQQQTRGELPVFLVGRRDSRGGHRTAQRDPEAVFTALSKEAALAMAAVGISRVCGVIVMLRSGCG